MENVYLTASTLKSITEFLQDNKVILHPVISPLGVMDFSTYNDRQFRLIIDRNILVDIINLVNKGSLKDGAKLKLISGLLFWIDFNRIGLMHGLALSEYAAFNNSNIGAKLENEKIKSIFNSYSPQVWIDLFIGKIKQIPVLNGLENDGRNFLIESDHFKMHYLEMLKISQLQLRGDISIFNKFKEFNNWVYDNILIGNYTTYYSAFVFKGVSKVCFNKTDNLSVVLRKCANQAWDLTYLSIWSTYYMSEENSKYVYLFATNDKELKEIFRVAHQKDFYQILVDFFKEELAFKIIAEVKNIRTSRAIPKIESVKLDHMILEETAILKGIIDENNFYN